MRLSMAVVVTFLVVPAFAQKRAPPREEPQDEAQPSYEEQQRQALARLPKPRRSANDAPRASGAVPTILVGADVEHRFTDADCIPVFVHPVSPISGWADRTAEALNEALVASGFKVVTDETKAHDLKAKVLVDFQRCGVQPFNDDVRALLQLQVVDRDGGALLTTSTTHTTTYSAPFNPPGKELAKAVAASTEIHKLFKTQAAGVASAPAPVSPAEPASVSAAELEKLVAAAPQPTAYALVVGVEKYRDVPAPTGARGDAERFAALLERTLGLRKENIRVALDDRASRADLDLQLKWLKANVPANSRLYFFFSGHGAPDASKGTPYLLPYDGNPSAVKETALPLADVLKSLGQTRAKEVLAFVDSCFSGSGGRSVLPAGARPLIALKATKAAPRVALFAASSGAEISGPDATGRAGLFTRVVTEGLGTGQADLDGDGQVTLKELADWVTPRVSRQAKRDNRDQTPSLTPAAGMKPQEVVVGAGYPAN